MVVEVIVVRWCSVVSVVAVGGDSAVAAAGGLIVRGDSAVAAGSGKTEATPPDIVDDIGRRPLQGWKRERGWVSLGERHDASKPTNGESM